MAARFHVITFPRKALSSTELDTVAPLAGMSAFDARQALSTPGLPCPLVQMADEQRAEEVASAVCALGIAAAVVSEEALEAARETRYLATSFDLTSGGATFRAKGLAPIEVRPGEVAALYRGRQDRIYRTATRADLKVSKTSPAVGSQIRSTSVDVGTDQKTIDDQFLAIYRSGGGEPIVLWARLASNLPAGRTVFDSFDKAVASIAAALRAPIDATLLEKRVLPAGLKLLGDGHSSQLEIADLACMMRILVPELSKSSPAAVTNTQPPAAALSEQMHRLDGISEPTTLGPESRRKVLIGAGAAAAVVAAGAAWTFLKDPLDELERLRATKASREQIYREALSKLRAVQKSSKALDIVLQTMRFDRSPERYSLWSFDAGYRLATGTWAGKHDPSYIENQYRLDIERVDGSTFEGKMTWLAKAKTIQLGGFVEGNHIVFSDFHDLEGGELGWLGPREVFVYKEREMMERSGLTLARRVS
ncbi:MAG: hypothetical protein HY791_28660 [Deltaproteobacteria bacterium]|nr:hypothetical protein [Deltaproteobacteria bacterium]